jgi:hypothetical protein
MTGKDQTLFEKQLKVRMNRSIDLLSMIRTAKKQSGKHPLSIVKDIWKLNRGDGKLDTYDYFQY